MRKIIFIISTLCLCTFTNAQSPKEAKEAKILKKTTSEINIEKGEKKPIIEKEETFNTDGEIVELKEYDKVGKLSNWVKYTFDANNNLIKETYLKPSGNIDKSIVYIYENGVKAQKQYFDDKDRMLKKKIYEYKFR